MMPVSSENDENKKNYEKVGRIYNQIKESRLTFDVRCIKHLLQLEGDINYRISEGSIMVPNLLHVASDEPKLVNMLLDNGIDFTRKDNEGRTVVHQIIRNKAIHFTRKDNEGTTVHHQIMRMKFIQHYQLLHRITFEDECIDLILAAHVKFNNISNPCDENGISHFHAACMTNNVAAVEFFLQNGVDLNQTVNADSSYFHSQTPIQFAVKYTCPDVVQVLLNYAANVYLKNASGFNPLHCIIERLVAKDEVTTTPRFVQTLNHLVKFVIDNATDDIGFSKLHVTCLLEDPTLVENVLNEVTNIDQAVNFDSPVCPGFTALHFAAFSNVQIFKLLLENEGNINAKNAKGETPFDLCLQYYTTEDIHSILLTKNEWGNIVLSDKETKLIDVVSAMVNFHEFISFLDRTTSALALYIPFDSPLWPGYTLLHIAVLLSEKIPDVNRPWFEQKDDRRIVVECIRRRANMTITDIKGSTALHLAFYMKKQDVVDYLLTNHDKSTNPVDEDNVSHFHIACTTGHLDAVTHFLVHGVDVNSSVLKTLEWQRSRGPNLNFFIVPGSTALHMSVARNEEWMARKLLKYGADGNARDANGFTPVHLLLSEREIKVKDFDTLFIGRVYDTLLSAKNLMNVVTDCGFSHLHVACYFGHYNSIKKLLKLGADVNAPLKYKCDDASFKDYDEFHFYTYGNPRRPLFFLSDYSGCTSLHFSSYRDDFGATSLLMKRNVDVFAKNDKGISPLKNFFCDVKKCTVFCANLVENHVLQESFEEKFGVTKLHLACHLADVKLVRNLINRGADVDAKVSSDFWIWRGFTPMHLTVKKVHEKDGERNFVERLKKIMELLMKCGADPLIVNDDDDTCFHMITPLDNDIFEDKSLLKVVLSVSVIFENLQDFIVNPTNSQGLSLFHIACMALNVTVIEKYLNHGVDVNQAISYFSEDFPGYTPLLLVINCVNLSAHHSRRTIESNTDTLLRIVDMLLENGANINATDEDGNTPLHMISRLGASQRIFIDKFISNGANIHAINVNGDNPLGTFINSKLSADTSGYGFMYKCSTTDWDDIEIFLKHGFDINMYNTITQCGYIWVSLIDKLFETQRILDVNIMGRTVLHNVVSHSHDIYNTHYREVVHRILNQGCDIDHEDDEGKTALHLAAFFDNGEAIIELLKAGSDINVIDKYGKSAFAYSKRITSPKYDDYLTKEFILHVYKLEFCGQRVSEQNKRLRDEAQKVCALNKRVLKPFYAEIRNTTRTIIGSTSISLYEFLMNDDMDIVYMDMTNEQRQEVDIFFGKIGELRFNEIDGLLKLKYRQTVKNTKLVEPALASFSLLIKYQLPDLCCRNILKFLQNRDLKRLIAATT